MHTKTSTYTASHTETSRMCQLLIRSYCKSSGTVLDPFMGSGTTPLAAKTTGRQYIGIEINPKYYKMAQNRVQGTL